MGEEKNGGTQSGVRIITFLWAGQRGNVRRSWLGFVAAGMMPLEQKSRVSGEYSAVLKHVWTEDVVQGQD